MPIVELTIDSSGALTGASQYDAATRRISKSTDSAIDSTNRWRDSLNKIGAVALTGLAAAGTAVAAFSIKAVSLASSLEETENKYDVVFRGMTDTTDVWAKDLQDSYLMTTEASKRFLSSTGDLLKPMGLTTEAAAKMSYGVTKLAADLGSFNDVDTATVMADIQSALVGNYETMKKYGVVINETVIKEHAYATGLASTGAALTSAQKAQSAYDLVLKGSSDALGDIARSAGSYANQMRLLKTNIEEFVTMVGVALLPAATSIVVSLNQLFEAQEKVNASLISAITIVQAFGNAALGVGMVLGTLVTGFTGVIELAWKFMNPLNALLIGLEKLGVIDSNPFEGLNTFFEGMTNAAADATLKAAEFTVVFNNSVEEAKAALKETAEIVDAVGKSIENSSNDAANGINNLTSSIEDSIEPTGNAAMEFYTYTDSLGNVVEILITAAEKAKLLAKAEADLKVQTDSTKDTFVDTIVEQNKLNVAQKEGIGIANDYAAAQMGVAAALSAAGEAAAGASAGGSRATGSTEFPEWFTPSMVEEWNKEYMDYLTNQDYISDFHAPGSGLKRDAYSSSGGPSGPGDPSAWASKRGYSATTEINVNVTTPINSNELAMLVSDLERAEARQ